MQAACLQCSLSGGGGDNDASRAPSQPCGGERETDERFGYWGGAVERIAAASPFDIVISHLHAASIKVTRPISQLLAAGNPVRPDFAPISPRYRPDIAPISPRFLPAACSRQTRSSGRIKRFVTQTPQPESVIDPRGESITAALAARQWTCAFWSWVSRALWCGAGRVSCIG